jgi:type 1 glutamine amidotransferase
VKPMAAAVAGAVISGVAMYAVGVRAPQADAFVESPALVQTLDGQYVAMARPASYTTALRPAATPVAERRSTAAAAPRRTVYRTVEPTEEQVVREEAQPRRSWGKTGLIIGGAAASGAGVGAIVDGKKGALIGAAIGGGAASIYEATRRR